VAFVNLATLLALALIVVAPLAAQTTDRVSVHSSGLQSDNQSFRPGITADGSLVVFHSEATNLVDADGNGRYDVFLRDRAAGTTTRLSESTTGVEGNNHSLDAVICRNGAIVVFRSDASNLVAVDTNASADVFLADLGSGVTALISVDSSGVQGDNASYPGRSVSGDGNLVPFYGTASNLVPGDTNNRYDVFVRDVAAGTTERVSVDSFGVEGDMDSLVPTVSTDGRYVAFESSSTNLVADDTNGFEDIFVHDRATGATTRVSVSSYGEQSNHRSSTPWISGDGRYVAFASMASNLVPNGSLGNWDIYVHDRLSGETAMLSRSTLGQAGNNASYTPVMTGDGRWVVFRSYASNLVVGDGNGQPDIFLRDREAGVTTMVSGVPDGGDGNNGAIEAALSDDAAAIAFSSYASNLVPDDTNARCDVFVHRRVDVLFQALGNGLAGSGDLMPHLTGTDGPSYDYGVRVWNGVGGAPALLFLAFAEAQIPFKGGALWVDLGQPWVGLDLVLSGPPGMPGAGAAELVGPDVSDWVGFDVYLQAAVGDAGAVQGVALSAALRMRINT
jgi:Tol biopolymer transport system component